MKRQKREEQKKLIELEEAKETLDAQKALKEQETKFEKIKKSRAASQVSRSVTPSSNNMDKSNPRSNVNIFDPMPSEDQEDDYGNKIVVQNVENLEAEEGDEIENIQMDDLEVREDLSNQIPEPNMETDQETGKNDLNQEIRAQKYVK